MLRLISISSATLLLIGLGCAEVRKATYPPEFKYMPEAAVRSSMWKLADQSVKLQAELRKGAPGDSEKRQAIVKILAAMEDIMGEVDPAGTRTNHPMLDQNLDQFRSDLTQARQAAEADPPNYFLAGSVAGGCLYCHGKGS
ncbi:MAG: hypothetical protein U1E65_20940 [Myxococcota bacterium]